MHRSTIGALCAALALGLAACGGGGSEPMSPTAFRHEANDVCRVLHGKIEALGKTAKSPREVDTARGKMSAEIAKAVDRLDALEPPEKLGASFSRLKASLSAQGEAVAKLAAHAELSKADRRAIEGHNDSAVKPATALGLSDCV